MRHILTYVFVFGLLSSLNGSAATELIKGYPDALVCELGTNIQTGPIMWGWSLWPKGVDGRILL